MTNSMKQTVIKNPTWWKRRTALERGLTVVAVSAVLLCVALAVSIGVVVSNSGSCNATSTTTAEALGGRVPTNNVQTVVTEDDDQDVCLSPGCITDALSVKKNMDLSVDPCDDFYKFACGGFINSTIIPADKGGVNTFTIIDDKLDKQLRTSIESESVPKEPKPFKLVKNLYNSCMNETAIEEKGLEPLHNVLKKLGGWPVLEGDQWDEEGFDWRTTMYKFREAGYSTHYFIDFSITVDYKNSTRRVIDLDQAGLGLSREYLSKGFDDKLVQAYYKYMVDIAVVLDADKDRATAELEESLRFEIELANISLPNEKRRNMTQLYNPTTLTKLTKDYPSVPWKEYLTNLMPPTISIEDDEIAIVNVPSYISKLEKLMANTSKRVQANYVMWRAVARSVSYLSDEVRKRQLEYSKSVNGIAERPPRWKECVGMVSGSLSLSVGAMYVRKYFNEQAKQNAVQMVADIRKQFAKILEQVEWMDDETRKSALEKAEAMSSYIAYPDELLDDRKLEEFYEKLELSRVNYFENILNLTRFSNDYMFSQFRKPVNKSNWIRHGSPAVVNAYYSAIENSIQFPAGILQGAFFRHDRPKYMNYGAIGFVIGHEITHGFDDQGRQFDKDGNLVDWWAPSTKEKYLERAQCIIDQYRNYSVQINETTLNLNGINTQGENIADNGGIKEAYLAYNDWVDRNEPEPKLRGLPYTPHQMFWISAANSWCSKYRPEQLKHRITTGFHSPGEFRILGPLSNMPEFAKDFNCPLGSRMNPVNKCSVW